jgi:hypothetical protein
MPRTRRLTDPGSERATPARTVGAALAPPPPEEAPPPYPETARRLLDLVPGALRDDERAYYASTIEATIARDWGAHFESGAVLDEFFRCALLSRESVLAGRVPGYGPLRLRYAAELARDLADGVQRHDTAVVSAAGASATGTVTLHSTRVLRRRAVRVLRNLAGRRSELQARIKKAAHDGPRPDEHARSLATLAAEIDHLRRTVPARVAQDAGATEEFVRALHTTASTMMTARETAQGGRGTVASSYDELNTLDGRLVHELRQLVSAMRDARVHDRTIPSVRSRLLRRPAKKKGAATGAAAGKGTGTGAAAAGTGAGTGTGTGATASPASPATPGAPAASPSTPSAT